MNTPQKNTGKGKQPNQLSARDAAKIFSLCTDLNLLLKEYNLHEICVRFAASKIADHMDLILYPNGSFSHITGWRCFRQIPELPNEVTIKSNEIAHFYEILRFKYPKKALQILVIFGGSYFRAYHAIKETELAIDDLKFLDE